MKVSDVLCLPLIFAANQDDVGCLAMHHVANLPFRSEISAWISKALGWVSFGNLCLPGPWGLAHFWSVCRVEWASLPICPCSCLAQLSGLMVTFSFAPWPCPEQPQTYHPSSSSLNGGQIFSSMRPCHLSELSTSQAKPRPRPAGRSEPPLHSRV